MPLAARALAFVIAALLLIAPSPARADSAALAESLFRQGVSAMEQGDLGRACGLLTESQRLDPGGGTVLNLALCHERAGHLATAWARYVEALGIARQDKREDRVTFAEQHLRAIEPQLPRLTIALAETPEGVRVSLDGVALQGRAWEVPSPVDPGSHEVRVEAPGRRAHVATVAIAAGESRRLAVPVLVRDLAPVAPVEQQKRPEPPRGGTQRFLGWTLTGIGGAALVGTAVLGALAIGAESTADAACPGSGACQDPRGVEASERASTLAGAATVTGIGGALALASGLVLLLTAPR